VFALMPFSWRKLTLSKSQKAAQEGHLLTAASYARQ